MSTIVLTDEHHQDRVSDVRRAVFEDEVQDRFLIGQLLDDGFDFALVVGDDRTLARAATARLEHNRDRAERLDFGFVDTGDSAVAGRLGAPSLGRKTVSRYERALERQECERATVQTLRVVDSLRPSAELAFSVGFGFPYEVYRTSRRQTRVPTVTMARMAADRGRDRAMTEADVYVDWESRADQFGYFIASTLEQTLLDIPMGNGPTFRLGRSVVEVLGARSRVGRLVQRATGAGAETFRSIHIDTNSGYVIDGHVVQHDAPRTVSITQGPTLRCLVP